MASYYNGGLTDAQVREMQKYYGAAADGKWGQNSYDAAGGMSARKAWDAYQQQKGSGQAAAFDPTKTSYYTGNSDKYQLGDQVGGSTSGNYSGSNTNGGGWYDNGGLTTDQIVEMQNYYGTAADGLWGQNSTAAAGNLNAQQAWQQYQQQKQEQQQETLLPEMLDFEDFYSRMGGADFEKMLRENINASVQQAVNAYEAQKQETEQDAQEMARQAYVAKLLGEKNMAQRLAAGGYAGGMAESAMLESEANYQNNLAEIQRQRQRALDEIQRAIDNARLTGDMEMANQLADYMAQVQSYYSDYYDQMLNQQMQRTAEPRETYERVETPIVNDTPVYTPPVAQESWAVTEAKRNGGSSVESQLRYLENMKFRGQITDSQLNKFAAELVGNS